MASRNYFINGTTELLILSLLNRRDYYAYEIAKAIKSASNGLLDISQNTIYTTTYKLESEQKISEYSKLVGKKRTRIYYHIEPDGRRYLKDLLAAYETTIAGICKILELPIGETKNEKNKT